MLDQTSRPNTKILVDGGDPEETKRVKELIGFVDGQTTNPTLIARNPEIAALVKSGNKLTKEEEDEHYRKIVESISPLVGDAGVSIEVFDDADTTAEQMFAEAQKKFAWIPNAYIKYPCTTEGLKAAKMSVAAGIRVNITLCFSQQQAAAVYAATMGAKEPVYVSPFVGRFDDHGKNGMDIIKNILEMYKAGDGHVKVLAASIRNLEHVLYTFALGSDLCTIPTKVLEEWAAKDFPMPAADYVYPKPAELAAIPYEQVALDQPWESYDLQHELTDAGIKKFVEDYMSTLRPGK